MMQSARHVIAILLCLVALPTLAACDQNGISPVDVWNANLDANCQPQDILDRTLAKFSPETFWPEQVKDLQSFIRGSQTSLGNSRYLLATNEATRDKLTETALQHATRRGLSAEVRRKFVADVLATAKAEHKIFSDNIDRATNRLVWAQRCLEQIALSSGGTPDTSISIAPQ